jgi:hypothetical protein
MMTLITTAKLSDVDPLATLQLRASNCFLIPCAQETEDLAHSIENR